MRLQEIKLAGFKSFVDPTTVVLPGSRCAVVGPNGCGKSNVVDAVRWVMGESSPRQLRSDALTDVIFSGSSARPATSLASVELVFDNRHGRVGGRLAAYGEIAVRREVQRDAQSTYFLNGTRCRRRDVVDVFLGTGFGPRSYSIIEQGMISELVEAKPEELRTYLEEAAGVSVYRERRRETQNRIRHTKENLRLVAVKREEQAQQLARLDSQRRTAERYRSLREEERRRKAELHHVRLSLTETQLATADASVRSLTTALSKAKSKRQAIETELEGKRAALGSNSDALNKAQGEYYTAASEVTRLEGQIDSDEQRAKQAAADRRALEAKRGETLDALSARDREADETSAELEAIRPQLEKALERQRKAAERFEVVEADVRRRQKDWDALLRRRGVSESELRVAESRIESDTGRLADLRADLAKPDEQDGEATEDVDAAKDRLAASERQLDAATARLNRATAEVDRCRENADGCEGAVGDALELVQSLRRDQAALSAVQAAALGRDDSAPGGAGGAAGWLEANGLGRAQRLGEALVVDAGWERAVETVLGADVQAVLVEDTASLAASLPPGISVVEGIGDDDAAHSRAAGAAAPGLDPLSSHVRGADGATRTLLAGVFAAERLATAIERRTRLAPGQSIILASGLWLGRNWIRFPTDDAAAAGVLERGRELSRLHDALADAETAHADRSAELSAARGKTQAAEARRDQLREGRSEAAAAHSAAAAEHEERRIRAQQARERARKAAERREALEAQAGDLEQDISRQQERLADATDKVQRLHDDEDGLKKRREAQQKELDRSRRQAADAKEEVHRVRLDLRGFETSLASVERLRRQLAEQRTEQARSIDKLKTEEANIADALPKLHKALDTGLTARDVAEGTLKRLRTEADRIETDIQNLGGKRNAAEQTVEQTRTALAEANVDCAGLRTHAKQLEALFNDTGLEREDIAAALSPELGEQDLELAIERLTRRIERLGKINLAAIDDYESLAEEQRHLDREYEDLLTALDTLEATRAELDSESRAKFKKTFEAVNAQLQVLFPKVFGGGSAQLKLTESNWLEAGVTLMAQPPGKRNANIHLLSGGEKAMVAVALIFSIFQLNPSPVCLLDEVDAPLDDSNVDRFAGLIQEMSSEVQFVVVTHNKRTIEMADHLLGVTMREAGVSRLVSVDLERATQLAAAG